MDIPYVHAIMRATFCGEDLGWVVHVEGKSNTTNFEPAARWLVGKTLNREVVEEIVSCLDALAESTLTGWIGVQEELPLDN